jgi:hypothetical protein
MLLPCRVSVIVSFPLSLSFPSLPHPMTIHIYSARSDANTHDNALQCLRTLTHFNLRDHHTVGGSDLLLPLLHRVAPASPCMLSLSRLYLYVAYSISFLRPILHKGMIILCIQTKKELILITDSWKLFLLQFELDLLLLRF